MRANNAISARIAALLDEHPVTFRAVQGGYTPAARWLVATDSGRSVFVKMGTTPMTVRALRQERTVYVALQGPFMPEMIAWQDHASNPLLILEDLSNARWPPPWDDDLVSATRTALKDLHASKADLQSFQRLHGSNNNGWQSVAQAPGSFLGLGFVSQTWLGQALPKLLEAADRLDTSGTDVVHLDVRSDNLCLTPSGVVLIDWNCACLGNGDLDLGFWLPSLAAEGGPLPDAILPDSPEIAAWVSGFFAARAGLPEVPDAPQVRSIQRTQLIHALDWAARALHLAPPTVPR